ncbi:Hypothetical protein ABZS17D1_03550 [Kosakonia cowanii]
MFLFKLSRRLYTLSFALPLCWLRLHTPVTYFCKLLGIFILAASTQHE